MPRAFDAIHAEFNGRLFNFLARLSRRRETAEDLLDETWLRFVDRADKLKPDTRLGPFLFTVARNLYLSYCRSRLLEDSQTADAIGLWPLGTQPPSPFESTVANETGRRIEAALASLPAAHREALLLVAVEGMKPAEAAAVCGITPEAMRQRLSRARAAIASHLDECDDPYPGALEGGDHMIETLPLLTSDASRSAKTIARCHDRLAARRRKIEARNRPSGARALGAERLLVARLLRGLSHCDGRRSPGHRRAALTRRMACPPKRPIASIGREGGTLWLHVLSLLIPIALSAVFVFIASSIIHMATPWHKHDLMKLPNEDGVMNALRGLQPAAGRLRHAEARTRWRT